MYNGLATAHYNVHGRELSGDAAAAKLLSSFLAESEAAGELARFPLPVHSALVAEYTLRFGAPPATGEELPAFARTLLQEYGVALKSAKKSSLAKFKTSDEAQADKEGSMKRKKSCRFGGADESSGNAVLPGTAPAGGRKSSVTGGASFTKQGVGGGGGVHGAAAAVGGTGGVGAQISPPAVTRYFTSVDEVMDTDTWLDERRDGGGGVGADGVVEAGDATVLTHVEWLVSCPMLLGGVILAILIICSLSVGLPWAMGDPAAQLAAPVNVMVRDKLTRAENAVALAAEYARERAVGAKLAVEVATRQAVAGHTLILLYEASRASHDTLR